ncbi:MULTISPECIES: cell division ATP-binding protein FtsE [Carnobacterium]|uniref:Cell division ATP-binding protein FtsE n=1 Tax=Carnobacterium inhibens subsp. gilichinskyi TaxID=1266845 RepID=U5SB96_9LACT|nr:cell division ATP-binding protein FtsE [Carnobacterium inhibens]AGY82326.1 cell division protein FtsE [Carnobacterium inhibens subsp. gilichinskyi]MCM3511845.1 cell division ATP-binding protein FtsE [Carnobacterium inhibens]
MIRMKNVVKNYSKGVKALRGINLTIEDGEFVYLVGASGSGKSTLAKLLYREEKATKGQIEVCGHLISKMKERDIPKLRRQIGIVFQDFKLLMDRTVYENIAYALEVIGTEPEEIEPLVMQALRYVELESKANDKPTDLSGGEQQRVSIARAIVNSPKLIIADEPTGNLDPQTALEIMRLFYRINQKGTTILMVTHNRGIVDKIRNRVVEIEQGKVVWDENKDEDVIQYDVSLGEYVAV